MKKSFIIMLSLVLSGCNSLERMAKKYSQSIEHKKMAFIGVNLIPMDRDTVLNNVTVYVDNDFISGISEGDKPVPDGYFKIQAQGKYMMPGLTDMHVHISDNGDMLKFLKYGVTSVRNMADIPGWTRLIGFSDILTLREKQKQKKIFGPDIYTCGFCLDGKKPVSPMNKVITDSTAARKEVLKEKKKGYDFIKIYDKLSPEAYRSIVAAAKENNMRFMGHVPKKVGIETALNDGIHSVEHLLGYIDNDIADYSIPLEKIDGIIEMTRSNPTYNCPTIVVWNNLPRENEYDDLKNNPEFKFVNGQIRWLWRTSLPYYYKKSYPDKKNYPKRMAELTMDLTKKLYEKECQLLIGTDANVIGTFVGHSTWQEMELFSKCGISNYDILCSATRTSSKALGKEELIGSIETGKKANLILLDKNPLENIENIRTIAGITINGFYFTRELIEHLVEKYYD